MSVVRERPRAGQSNAPRIAALIIGLVLLGGFGLWAYNRTRPEAAVAARRDITPGVSLQGEVVAPPGQRADIMPPFEAPVEKVLATIGQNVRRGDVLAELSAPSTDAALEQARASVKAAETAYANAKDQSSAEVRAAEKQVEAARAAERQAPAAPAAPVTGAEGSSPESTAPGTPPTSSVDLEQATQARIAAEQAVTAAKAQRDAALIPFQQQLDAARETFRQAQAGEKMTQVRSPIRGTVLALNARPGEVVKTDGKTPFATIVDLDELEVQSPLPAEYASTLKPGMDGTLLVAEVPNEQFGARVHSIVTAPGKLGKQPGFLAILHVKNKDGLVKPAMKARAAIKLGETRNVLAVPVDAVKTDKSGRPVVKVLRNGKWVDTVVETGISDGQYMEIKSGLQEGDTVQVKQDLV